MLTLVTGRKLNGKTKYIFSKIAQAANINKSVILIVPEQFSFEAEKQVLLEFGPKIANKIKVYSFPRLCEAIWTELGGINGSMVDDGTRFILTMKAMNAVKDQLTIYKKYYNSPEFCTGIMRVIYELKQAAISTKVLDEFIDDNSKKLLSSKLKDISLIMSAYNALLKNKYIDPLDILEKTKNIIAGKKWFSGKYVFFDMFEGFTKSQYNLIENIIAESENTYFTLCTDSVNQNNELSIFTSIKETAQKLKDIAENHFIKVETVQLKNNKSYGNLSELESVLADQEIEANCNKINNISICKCDDTASELCYVYENILHLTKNEGYRYKDIVIIARNSDAYLQALKETSNKYCVPTFIDDKLKLKILPISRFILSAFESTSFNTENIFKFLKSGLTKLTDDEIFELENYTYIWSINGKKWLENWDMSADGLDQSYSNDKEYIERINEIRKKVVAPIINFKNNLGDNSLSISKAVLQLINECNTKEKLRFLAEKLEENEQLQKAEALRQGYAKIICILDKLTSVFGNEQLPVKEYLSYFKSELDFEVIGEIPQTVDQVIFGAADNLKPATPKIVFILGANLGNFPSTKIDTGLLSAQEKKTLTDFGISFTKDLYKSLLDERFLFYSSVCSATDKVFITYNCSVSDTDSGEPCQEISKIQNHFERLETVNYKKDLLKSIDNVYTKKATFERTLKNINTDSEIVASLVEFFVNDPDYSEKMTKALSKFDVSTETLSIETAKRLYAKSGILKFSASKLEDFSKCRFRFFCRYGLRVSPLKKAEIDPATRGTIVHFILETFINDHKNTIGTLSADYIKNSIDKYVLRYFAEICIDMASLDNKIKYMLGQIKETSANLLTKINNEFNQSDFVIDKCELTIGGKNFPSLDVNLNYGCRLSITGKIDRVDRLNDGNTRIVDYKTGRKIFNVSDILYGLNMQMLIYLYALVKNGKVLYNEVKPAGVLYFPAFISDNEDSDYIKMNGLLIDDINVLNSMEKGVRGKIIPASLNKDGSFSSSTQTATKQDFDKIFKHIDATVKRIGNSILDGDLSPNPIMDGSTAQCKYCDFYNICKVENNLQFTECINYKKDEVFEMLSEGSDIDGSVN